MPTLNRLKNAIVPFLIALLVVLLAAFTGVMFFESAQGLLGGLLGLSEKNEILKFLGFGMGGVLLVIQAGISYRRARALEDAANAQADAARAQAGATAEQAKANQNSEKGLRQERLKNAIEHLGHESDSVRLGGAYELFHLAEDTKSLRQTVLDILCAHIRRMTSEDEYRQKHKSKPSEEIQSLLTLLFVQEHDVFEGLPINLNESWLNGADLQKARLRGAALIKAHLQRVNLGGVHLEKADMAFARLQEAILKDAYLQGVSLRDAFLQGANLRCAQLQEVFLTRAQLQGADFLRARLQGAFLSDAYLRGVTFTDAQLCGADLCHAHLQGANLAKAWLHGATLYGAQLQGVDSRDSDSHGGFIERINRGIDRQSTLFGVIFEGGLSREEVDAIVEGLSDEGAKRLRMTLGPHIGQPKNHELPKDSEAITGAYSAEEAERWIFEYEIFMRKTTEMSDS